MKINKKDIKSQDTTQRMKDRSMPICFTAEQYGKIEEIAKQKGMLNASQLIEKTIDEL